MPTHRIEEVILNRIGLRKVLFMMAGFALLLNTSVLHAECEADVDLADSLDFRSFHSGCEEDSENVEEVEKKTEVTGIQRETNTPAKNTTPLAAGIGVTAGRPGRADGQVMEPFSINTGMESAQTGLLIQLSNRCENGWRKLAEWVTKAEVGYILHYDYRCL